MFLKPYFYWYSLKQRFPNLCHKSLLKPWIRLVRCWNISQYRYERTAEEPLAQFLAVQQVIFRFTLFQFLYIWCWLRGISLKCEAIYLLACYLQSALLIFVAILCTTIVLCLLKLTKYSQPASRNVLYNLAIDILCMNYDLPLIIKPDFPFQLLLLSKNACSIFFAENSVFPELVKM